VEEEIVLANTPLVDRALAAEGEAEEEEKEVRGDEAVFMAISSPMLRSWLLLPRPRFFLPRLSRLSRPPLHSTLRAAANIKSISAVEMWVARPEQELQNDRHWLRFTPVARVGSPMAE
jgi:hypothetical protein